MEWRAAQEAEMPAGLRPRARPDQNAKIRSPKRSGSSRSASACCGSSSRGASWHSETRSRP
eukprot:4062311-Alexandrium_andersonii.AAC.1